MSKKIKYLSLILSFAVAFGMMPLMAFADTDLNSQSGAPALFEEDADASAGENSGTVVSDQVEGIAINDEEQFIDYISPTSEFTDYHVYSDSSGNSAFKVKVPANGYLFMYVYDPNNAYSVRIKTSGFKDYEYLNSQDPHLYVGVKKGTYTFNVNTSASVYNISIKLVKVKEGKYGKSKKKASTVKRKSTRKGLIIANSKKTHWYKFKNKNGKKMTLTLGLKMNDGGSYGCLKVTAYQGKRNIGSGIIYASTAKKVYTITTTLSSKKASKGTYYLKVQSYNGGNGYFTFKWK